MSKNEEAGRDMASRTGFGSVLVGTSYGSEDKLRARQAQRIAARFRISVAHAAVVASLALDPGRRR